MPRSSAQSDFAVDAPSEPPPELPRASAGATRAVMIFAAIVLIALVVLCVVGPHIPAGE